MSVTVAGSSFCLSATKVNIKAPLVKPYTGLMDLPSRIVPPKETRARGRRTTFDRDEALQTALELFWRYGYEGVSITTLTQSIGIAAPSLYHAFGSKEDLFREVVLRYQSAGLSAREIAECSSGFEAAKRILAFGIATATRTKQAAGCMVSSGLLMCSPEHAELAAYLKRERAKQRTALQERIQRDIEKHVLATSVSAARLARFYMAVLQGISVQAIDGASQADLIAVMETALLSWPTNAEVAI